jgi:hypothetical protein
MVTTKNSSQGCSANSDGVESLPSDGLILILNDIEHAASLHGDMLKYVHEKSRCYNVCEKGEGAKCLSYKRGGEGKLMISTEIAGGDNTFAS